MIVSGELAPEAHVEEIKLSEALGISRTPVREALIALEHEGLVRSRPRKGFVVVRRDVGLVRESYPVLAGLEAAALRLSAESLRADLSGLRRLNQALARERKKARQYELDRAFHAALTDGCGNARLQGLLAMERARVQLVDGAHERGMANLDGSVAEHDTLIAALERGDDDGAANMLSAHWRNGVEVVAKWLEHK